MTRVTRETIERTLAGKRGRTYWRSLHELAETPGFDAFLEREMPHGAAAWDGALDRRAVVKAMGASLGLFGLVGCGRPPEEEIVPYVEPPEDAVPGVPRYYATATIRDGYAHGVIGETHEGRPIRLKGNPDHPGSLGAADVFSQAEILSLYDPDRSGAVRNAGRVDRYDRLLAVFAERRRSWRSNGGAGLCVMTGERVSPTTARLLRSLRDAYPRMRWYGHEAVSRRAVRDGAIQAFGRPLRGHYDFAAARVVFALDGDFLGPEEPDHLRHARGLASARRMAGGQIPPARLYAVESVPSVTGAAADHRLPSSTAGVGEMARGLARRIGVLPAGDDGLGVEEARWLDVVARDLGSARGQAPVVAGMTQPAEVHALIHAINDRLGNFGKTIRFTEDAVAGPEDDIVTLSDDMAAGRVETLLILDGNPVLTAPADLEFAERLPREVPLCIHWGRYYDETARRVHWHVPAAHELETWGDGQAVDGTVTIQQPLITPLHGGRSALEVLGGLDDGISAPPREMVRATWRENYTDEEFEHAWRAALKKGIVADTAFKTVDAVLAFDPTTIDPPTRRPSAMSVQFRPDPAAWDGRYANNAWLQELPRPLTKTVWGNSALVAPATAERLGVKAGRHLRIARGGRSVQAPVLVQPGHPRECVTLTFGLGRANAGRVGDGVGYNAYPLRTSDAPWHAEDAEIEVLDTSEAPVSTQRHHALEDRGLVREATWRTWLQEPEFARREGDDPQESLYPEPAPDGRIPGADGHSPYDWGMSIDFGACIGCNACVIACQSENNIATVGKEQAARGREMHWLRIDRYYRGPPESPDTVFQPIPCMHCENAPCEYVCPVEATLHSSEGLNEMVYNRCIGTRYCSQNCPYKVRRFNWFDFTGDTADFPADPARQNPDVSVRGRGVMEKCTYCVQRINRARIEAEQAGRDIADGDVVTACQEACPTQAIVFGNIEDPNSGVSRRKRNPRDYGLLEGLNTRPRTSYLAAVRNPNTDMEEMS